MDLEIKELKVTLNKPPKVIAKYLKIFKSNKLIDKLSPSRASNFDDWLKVGRNLYGFSQGTNAGLTLWKQFTELNPGEFTQEYCERMWADFDEIYEEPGNYEDIGGLHNLLNMIKKDNSVNIFNFIISGRSPELIPEELNNFLYRPPEMVAGELKLIQDYKLIDLLKSWRANKNHLWLDIGEILYSAGQGSEMALDLWIDFTEKKSARFTREDCVRKWECLPLKMWDFRFLCKVALEDNPSEGTDWGYPARFLFLNIVFGVAVVYGTGSVLRWFEVI